MTDRSVSIALIAKVQGYVAGMKTAQLATSKLTTEIAKSAKKQQALRELGNAAGAMGVAAAAGLFLVVRAAANFDQAMSRVAATGNDAKENLDALRVAAIQAGQATIFSATEAADGVTELIKAGVSAKDVLSGGLIGALNLASAGELGVADAANIMATAMSQFNLPGADATHVADLLAAAAGKAQGEVSDMAQALKYVGPVAASMGVSIEETTGTIAELANKGILADQAGTSLRGMLTALTSPSKVAATEMEKLGINVYDATGNFVGFKGIAGQLQGTMGKLSNAERDQALGRIFGNQQITAARILYAGGAADVAKWTDAVNDQGFAADTAATKLDNLMGDLEQLRGSLETAFIGTGSGAQTPLRELVQDLTSLVNAFSNLPGPVKNGVAVLLLLTAGVGLTTFAASRAVLAYTNFNARLVTLGMTAPKATAGMVAFRGAMLGVGVALAEVNSHVDNENQSAILSILSGAAFGTAISPGWGTAIGAAAGGLQAITAHASSAAAAEQKLADAGQAVANTLNQQTGAITDATRAAAEKELADTGAFDAAEKMGISLGDTTLAAQGNEEALKKVTAAALVYAQANGVDGVKAAQAFLASVGASVNAIDNQRESIKQSNTANSEMASQAAITSGKVATLTQGQRDAAAATKQWTAQLQHLSDVLSDRSSIRDYEAALDAARKASKSHADITHEDTDAQRKAQSAFDAVASAALAHKAAMDKAGKSTDQQNAFLKQASDDLTTLAGKFNTGKLSAKEYADQVLKIPKIAKTTAQLATEAAKQAARNLVTYIENLDPTMTVHEQHVAGRTGYQAAGGTVTGGTPGKDSVLTMLMPDEEVIRASSARKHRPLLKLINGMADGGTVGGGSVISIGDGHSISDLDKSVQSLDKTTKTAAETYQDSVDQLHQMQQEAKQYAQTVAAAFTHDAFGGSMADSELQLRADRNDAREARKDLKRARRHGLDGPLARMIAASGNTGLIDELAHASRSEIRQYEQLYRQRARQTRGIGQEASQAAYGRQIRQQTAETRHLHRAVQSLNKRLDTLGKSVEDGARKGTHEGTAHRQRAASASRRAS